MSIYAVDDNGNERARIIIVNEAGDCVETGNPVSAQGPYFRDANGVEYLLVIQYDEAGNAL